MALMLALIFGAILLCRVLGDKAGTAAYDRQRDARQKQEAEWEAKYTDRSLEYRLTTFIDDPRNYEAVRDEVIDALKEMGAKQDAAWSWSYEINGGFTLTASQETMNYIRTHHITKKLTKKDHEKIGSNVSFYNKLALDIMLANRGKISNNTAHWGFEAHNKMAGYARFEWIRDTLHKQGVNVTPIYLKARGCFKDEFGWEGSHYSHSHPDPYYDTRSFTGFSAAIAEPTPVSTIPPAYYNKTE
jgi:hypothetical protein